MTDEALAQAREEHIARCLGESAHVYYDVGTSVPVDVHLIGPTASRPFYLLVTTGMSDRAMAVSGELEGAQDHALAELVLALPRDWFPHFPDVEHEDRAWPARLLARLAALPHQHGTWLGIGHTVPSPQGPYHRSTSQRCAVLLPPLTTPASFRQLRLLDGRVVSFHAVVLLYGEEAQRKLEAGLQALLDAFEEARVTELLDPRRPNLFPPQLDSAVFKELENTETVSLKLGQAQALLRAGRSDEAAQAFHAIAELHPAERAACEEGIQAALESQEPDLPTELDEDLDEDLLDEDDGVPTQREMLLGCAALGGGTLLLLLLGFAALGLVSLTS